MSSDSISPQAPDLVHWIRTLIFLVLVFFCSFPVFAFEVPEVPNGYILDQADVLSPQIEADLTQKITDLQADNSSQIALVTLETLDGYPLEMAALEIARTWWIGQAESDNGLLLLLVVGDRDVRIEVGRGLEGVVTDAEASSIIHTRMIPRLREQDYDGAVQVAVDRMIALAREEVFPVESFQDGSQAFEIFIFVVILLLWFGWGILSFLSSTKSWWIGGVFGGIIGAIVFTWWAVLIGIFLGLILDYILSKYFFGKVFLPPETRWWSSWWGRSGGGWWGWFGGFGGGGFGWGGSSGSW